MYTHESSTIGIRRKRTQFEFVVELHQKTERIKAHANIQMLLLLMSAQYETLGDMPVQ